MILVQLQKEKAEEFFTKLFDGLHNAPAGILPYGYGGYSMACRQNLATFDYDTLTRLVVIAHDMCIRAEIIPKGMKMYLITLHQRERNDDQNPKSFAEIHPTIEVAVKNVRDYLSMRFPNYSNTYEENKNSVE